MSIVRPNGKPYRPRKIVTHPWENQDGDGDRGVVVLGTHDVEEARVLAAEACSHWFGSSYAIEAAPGWYRLGYTGYRGELSWTYDPERGRAGVFFTASDDPEE
jgi:hypothetical protein